MFVCLFISFHLIWFATTIAIVVRFPYKQYTDEMRQNAGKCFIGKKKRKRNRSKTQSHRCKLYAIVDIGSTHASCCSQSLLSDFIYDRNVFIIVSFCYFPNKLHRKQQSINGNRKSKELVLLLSPPLVAAAATLLLPSVLVSCVRRKLDGCS